MSSAKLFFVLAVVAQFSCGTPPNPVVPTHGACPKPEAVEEEKVFDTGKPPLPPGLDCLRRPLADYRRVSSPFMDPHHTFTPGKHDGTDFPAPVGTSVLAPVGGEVVWTRAVAPCEDAAVSVRFADGWVFAVHHLSRVDVAEGETVVPGQRLGLSGGEVEAPGSGPWTTGPHLHFMLVHDGAYVNSERYFCP